MVRLCESAGSLILLGQPNEESQVTEVPFRSDREDAALWAAISNAVVQSLVTIDADGLIRSINQSGLRMFGYEESELIGRNVSLLMPSPDAEHHDDYLRSYFKTGVTKIVGIGREVTAKRKDGTTFPVHLSVGEYRRGNHPGFVGLVQDMTAQREAEARLVEHAADAKVHRERLERMDRISAAGEMASGIAHEVNQPLSAIANYSRAVLHMLDVEGTGSEQLKSTVEKIRLQSHRAGEIVRRMRDFVSQHSAEVRPISVNDTVDEVLSFAELSSRGHKVSVDRQLEDELPSVLFDRVQLQQVIVNLVNNAVEAIQPGQDCRLRIRTFCAESNVTLQVVDNGIGIDEITENRLFEPFFSSKRDGTGMGLAISHSIVEAQGGTLGFFRNPDRGVTFYVQLPACRDEEPEDV